ncbi:MAG: CotH kinase family protein, partial [Bacteroidaceae bacterium]|nr:CotH kinase family protein [Bacteroidaceae bacterium]
NVDAYTLSTFMYMKEKEGRKESYLKFTLWDFNLAYGNCNYNDHWRTDVWVYPSKDIKGESPFWITLMMQKPEYVTMLKNRWKQMRQENLSEEHIFLVIDSLCQNLSSHNALLRDSTAWKSQWQDGCMITHYWPQKYVSTTYIDEINHLKCWIKERLYWMDEQLLNN